MRTSPRVGYWPLGWGAGLLLPFFCGSGVGSDALEPTAHIARSFYIMGTRAIIEADGPENRLEEAAGRAYSVLETVDRLMSTYRDESELSRFNRGGQAPFVVSPETLEVVEEALRIADGSGGAFDPTVGPLTRLWGHRARIPPPEDLSAALARVGYRYLMVDHERRTLHPKKAGVEIDLGGIAKGYAVDRAAAALRRHGAESGLVDLGESSIGFFGARRRFAIRDPLDPDRLVAWFTLEEGTVSTSAGYEKGFEEGGQWYSHILDPRSGMPVPGSLSATVLGAVGHGMRVDALSTAGFVLGPEGALALWRRSGVEGILFYQTPNGPAWVATRGFPFEKETGSPAL